MSKAYAEYPAWRFHSHLKARVVADPNEDLALGEGWRDTPNEVQTLVPPAPPNVPADPPTPEASPVWKDPNVTMSAVETLADKSTWYTMLARLVVVLVGQLPTLEDIEHARKVEARHPVYAGGRGSVVKAIAERERVLRSEAESAALIEVSPVPLDSPEDVHV